MSYHFRPILTLFAARGVVLLQLSVVPQIADRTDSVRKYDKYDKNQIRVKMGTLKRIPIILKHSLHA